MSKYVECHLHDFYSLLDGSPSPEEYMVRAKELGMTHLAQTNHGTLSGLRHFQRAAKDAGIVPILGVEAYLSPTDMFDRRSKTKRQDGTDVYNHATMLAIDEPGLKTLSRLSEKAWKEGFYQKPRMDTELIMSDNEGIIVLSGCLNGLIPKAIERGDMVYARDIARQYKEGLGDRFFIEVQGHNPPYMNKALLEIADKFRIPAVATSDCHYARKDELWFQEAMLILSTHPKRNPSPDMAKMDKMDILERLNYLYPDRKMTFQEIEIYLRGYEDQRVLFERQGIERTDILSNTMEIANRIGEYPYYEGLDLLPRPDRPEDEVLKELARNGMDTRGLSGKQEYEDRLEHELDIIHKKKFESYFIVVADMVKWAKEQGIPVGPGRGSAGGSLLNYALGITDVDPIEHSLVFSRFLDESRPDMPDIDIDFSDEGRVLVKQYLINKYGHAASIATFPTFKGKSAIRSASSVLGVPIADVNKALKGNDGAADEDYLEFFQKTEQGKDFSERHPLAMELANYLEGRIRTGGMHPAGMVISKEPLSEFMPIQTGVDPNDKQGPRVEYIALDMEEVANVGGIKIDILGLKNLRVLDNARKLVEKRHGKDIDFLSIPLDDKKTYKMLHDGKTLAVFQMEGPAFTKWIKETRCENFTDIVNGTAISRPGAMDSIGPDYKDALLGRKTVNYKNSVIYDITKDTLSHCIFQEQVMRMVTDLAGMSQGDANKIRKIIGKKRDVSEFDEFKDRFIEGASKQENVTEADAKKLWKDFEKHANYSFNRCLVGSTTVRRSASGRYVKDPHITLEELYENWHSKSAIGNKYRDSSRGVKIYGMDSDGRARYHRVAGVFKNGVKDVWKITLDDGKSIVSTGNHKHWTERGYLSLDDGLSDGDVMAVCEFRYDSASRVEPDPGYEVGRAKVVSIEYVGKEMTYDIEMDSEEHNFFANGILTHNSHAVAYSYVTYWTAWFKANYPLEYMAAVIAAEEDQDVRTNYIIEANKLGIKVRPPHINEAEVKASIVGDAIMLGLEDIKYIAKVSAEKIIKHRPYSSYEDFNARAKGVNARMKDALNKIGAARFKDNPTTGEEKDNAYEYLGVPARLGADIPEEMLERITPLEEYDEGDTAVVSVMVRSVTKRSTWGRISVIDSSGTADVFINPEDDVEVGKMYIMLLAQGAMVTHKPVEEYDGDSVLMWWLKGNLEPASPGKEIAFGWKARKTKKGAKMATAVVMDEYCALHPLLVFPGQYHSALGTFRPGQELDIIVGETRDGTRFIDGFR